MAITPEHQFQIIHQEVNMALSVDQLKQSRILIDFYPLIKLENHKLQNPIEYEPKKLYHQLGEEQFICFTMAKNFYEFIFIPMLIGIPLFVVQ